MLLFPRFHLWLRDRQTKKLTAYKPTATLAPRVAASMFADKALCDAMAAQGITAAPLPTPAPTPPGPAPASSSGFWRFDSNTVLSVVIALALLVPYIPWGSIPNPFGPHNPPTPVIPVDPFVTTLQEAYNADAASDKAVSLAALKGVWSNAPMAANDAKAKTLGDVLATIKAVGKQMIGDKLMSVRTVIGAKL